MARYVPMPQDATRVRFTRAGIRRPDVIRAAPAESYAMQALDRYAPAARRALRTFQNTPDNPVVALLRAAGGSDPMGAIGGPAGAAAIPGRLEQAAVEAEELSQRMKGVNQYLGQRRTPFAAGLEPPPAQSLPVREYATEQAGRGVDVTGETVLPPERITPEQARAAGVNGPVPYETPKFRFTRQGPRVEVTGNVPKPLKLYHGTDVDFDAFDINRAGSSTDEGLLGHGLYFGTDPAVGRSNRFLKSAEVSLKKPLELTMDSWKGNKKKIVREALGLSADASAKDVTSALKAQGYDAVTLDYSPIGYNHKEVMVPSTEGLTNVTTAAGGAPHKPAIPSKDVLNVSNVSQSARAMLGSSLGEFQKWIESGYHYEDDSGDGLVETPSSPNHSRPGLRRICSSPAP